jgi:hypothetical protein
MRTFEKNRRNETTPAIPPHAPSNFLPDAFRYRVLARNGHANRDRVRIVRRFHVRLSFRAITAAVVRARRPSVLSVRTSALRQPLPVQWGQPLQV